MAKTFGTGLARVTIAAPKRRIDVALPDMVPAAELLPGLLRHAGDDLADNGQAHGGWVLRRADGSMIDPARSLSAHDLRDGEVLHLVARRDEWPEMDYDDVVDVMATGARRNSRSWGGLATRQAGVSIAVGIMTLVLVLIVASGPSWFVPGLLALVLAVVLAVSGVLLSRSLADSAAGAALATMARPFAAAGGLVVSLGERSLGLAGPAQYLAASAALLITATAAILGVADRIQYFVAGLYCALLGVLGSLLGFAGLNAVDVAAVLVTVAVALMPAFPLLAIRLGKLPMPTLPATAEDLLADPPMPPRARVYGAVMRTDELLTGLLLGAAVVMAIGQAVLVASGDTTAIVLVVLVAMATLLRARLFPTARHRVPLLAAGLAGLTALALASLAFSAAFRLGAMVPILTAVGGLVVAAGLTYSRKQPSPYLGRYADWLDVLLVVAVVPVMCGVVGLYGFVRGLSG
ncbi:MAG TPA: type VII secretion integral membrane protein EccD [Cryptosporangiaceae bacterium]|nr:type VII secretion integral membrane protein EccD [Cryptosporangiaceae bacterium]